MTGKRLPTLTVSPDKVLGYLLDVDHPEGRSKARWFLARGFRRDNPIELATNLAGMAFVNWPGTMVDAPPHGTKHKIIAPLACPDGSLPAVLAIWIVEPGENVARFVTARPYRLKAALDRPEPDELA